MNESLIAISANGGEDCAGVNGGDTKQLEAGDKERAAYCIRILLVA